MGDIAVFAGALKLHNEFLPPSAINEIDQGRQSGCVRFEQSIGIGSLRDRVAYLL
jgi:hypothetical protein